jgi:hypothetical protein
VRLVHPFLQVLRDYFAKLEDQRTPFIKKWKIRFHIRLLLIELTLALSAELAPCTQIPGLTRHPKLVETHRMFNPRAWNNLQNCCVN